MLIRGNAPARSGQPGLSGAAQSGKRFLTLFAFALGMASLLLGIWGGLIRLGWAFPRLTDDLFLWHGPLMITGFLATLIGLERAVAYAYLPAYAGPILTGAGTLSLLAGLPTKASLVIICLGSFGLLPLSAFSFRRHPTFFTFQFLMGAFALLLGNVLWLFGFNLFQVSFYWGAFLVLTIVAERQELARILQPSRLSQILILSGTILVGVSLLLLPMWYKTGVQVLGAGMILYAIWLLFRDPVKLNLRREGLPQYISIGLLCGYFWLLVAGVFAIVYSGATSGFLYDATLHSLFLGFVFSMIFSHMPIIFPALLGLSITFSRTFYVPVALLHLSVLLRISGDLGFFVPARLWGGLLNAVAILFFLVTFMLKAGSMQIRN